MIGLYVNINEGGASASLSFFYALQKTASRLFLMNFKLNKMDKIKQTIAYYQATLIMGTVSILHLTVGMVTDTSLPFLLAGFFFFCTFLFFESECHESDQKLHNKKVRELEEELNRLRRLNRFH